ncbi:MAG: cell envelope integrity protein CreD [Betaproteobacteria bacterium]|nr:cell envelope integrity protein CreD [Betaproteobacteria bacterium]
MHRRESAVQKTLLIKSALVGLLFLLLQVPLQMINGLVAERATRQREVVQDIAASSSGRQVFAGPILSVPYVEEYEETVVEEKNNKSTSRIDKKRIQHAARFFPAVADINGKLTVGTKHRGLFKARIFSWQARVQGEFVFDGKFAFARSRENSRLTMGSPFISIALADPRGLGTNTEFQWSGTQVALARGTQLQALGSGVHALIPDFDPGKPARFDYLLDIALQGTESLALMPMAQATRMRLESDWPHPSFGGKFLPMADTRVGQSGFEAAWNVSGLASSAQSQFLAAMKEGKDCFGAACADRIEVRFIEPIDIYSLSDRALKYGFLFIGLTFGAFLAFEILKRLPIHPAQYFLVGAALAAFFLLLIGFSEHVAFWLAYAIASAACIALLGFYLSAVLNSRARGSAFAAMLTALYGALYGLLISEDNTLLLGSMLVFGALAVVLILTRRVDWYALGPVK